MLKIYHNPRCSKSRAGLQYLNDNNMPCQVVDYLNENLTAADIKALISKTGLTPFDLVRTHEEYYKTNLKDKHFTDDEWCKILAENPKLLHRPIVVNGNKAIVAQPANKINELL